MADTTLTDPLGNTVTLHDTTWVRHIVRRHPAVGPYREQVEQAITTPTVIQQSRSDPDCLVYYGRCEDQFGAVQVVADVRRGIVKTAFLCLGPARGDQVWP